MIRTQFLETDRLDVTIRNAGSIGQTNGATAEAVTPRFQMVELRGTEFKGYEDEAPEPRPLPSSISEGLLVIEPSV